MGWFVWKTDSAYKHYTLTFNSWSFTLRCCFDRIGCVSLNSELWRNFFRRHCSSKIGSQYLLFCAGLKQKLSTLWVLLDVALIGCVSLNCGLWQNFFCRHCSSKIWTQYVLFCVGLSQKLPTLGVLLDVDLIGCVSLNCELWQNFFADIAVVRFGPSMWCFMSV